MKPEIRSKMVKLLEQAIEVGYIAPTFGSGLTDDDFTALRFLVQLRGLEITLSTGRSGNITKTYHPTPESDYVLRQLKHEESADEGPPSDHRPLGFRTSLSANA